MAVAGNLVAVEWQRCCRPTFIRIEYSYYCGVEFPSRSRPRSDPIPMPKRKRETSKKAARRPLAATASPPPGAGASGHPATAPLVRSTCLRSFVRSFCSISPPLPALALPRSLTLTLTLAASSTSFPVEERSPYLGR